MFITHLDVQDMNSSFDEVFDQLHVVLNIVFGLVGVRHIPRVADRSFDDTPSFRNSINTDLKKEGGIKYMLCDEIF